MEIMKTNMNLRLIKLFFAVLLFTLSIDASAKQPEVLLGGIIRGDASEKQICLVFTGDEYADGANVIMEVLERNKIKGAFF